MTPEQIRSALCELARNHRWTWDPRTRALLLSLPNAAPTAAGSQPHPIAVVDSLSDHDLVAWAESRLDEIEALGAEIEAVADSGPEERTIAYFSPEFGVSDLVPQYSGGLGILAGDHLKASSDLGIPLVAVGLFYSEGFFRQSITDDGLQGERYEARTAESIGHTDTGVRISVEVADELVTARVVKLEVGAVSLYLLDTNIDANSAEARAITDRLYSGDRQHRLRQELILGIGGMRALAALGYAPVVIHLNEGHAGFSLLELLAPQLDAGATLEQAVHATQPRVLFTTHTPVPAGIDTFDDSLVTKYLDPWSIAHGIEPAELRALGAMPGGPAKEFNMAAFCLRLAGAANGVSLLHGEVSRQLFAALPMGERIGHVTNGVHAQTWTADHLHTLFDAELGPGWSDGEPEPWARASLIPDDLVRAARLTGRQLLVDDVAARTGVQLDPEALTVGFARRFATYKRADLLLRDRARLIDLLADDDKPIQFVFAGKSHPNDDSGKAVLARVVEFARSPESNGRFVFVPDYSIGVARALYAGCDVWLNNPVRPREASGTSGEKSALNGGLNLSISDGWWAEMADGDNGWTIPNAASDDTESLSRESGEVAARDDAEAESILDILGDEVIPLYYADSPVVPSAAWLDRVRFVWTSLGPLVSAGRMLRDYDEQLYRPAVEGVRG